MQMFEIQYRNKNKNVKEKLNKNKTMELLTFDSAVNSIKEYFVLI